MTWLWGSTAEGDHFDEPDEFVPEHLPRADDFLRPHTVLTGDAHVRVHEIAYTVFEEAGVYDVTFGYNLARLNQDRRHPDAGFRYATTEADLLATFTPTTAMCPQSTTLSFGAFRAWNASDRHDFDVVRIRVHDMHQTSVATNAELRRLESVYETRGEIVDAEPAAIDADIGDEIPTNVFGDSR